MKATTASILSRWKRIRWNAGLVASTLPGISTNVFPRLQCFGARQAPAAAPVVGNHEEVTAQSHETTK